MRSLHCLNRGWKFVRADVTGAEAPTFDDSDWQRVGLPHTFDLPYFRTPEFYVGVGWYRRTLDIPAEWIGRAVWLHFEAAFQVADVYLNGVRIGGHRGGYTDFTIDLTGHLKPGENVLAVRVDNAWNPRLSPRAGEHIFSGGLYRDVWLGVANHTHVATNGVFIKMASIDRDHAVIEIETEIRQTDDSRNRVSVMSEVLDPRGKVVMAADSSHFITPGKTTTARQILPELLLPELWHPDHPNLYTLRTTLHLGKRNVLDVVHTRFGLRWFEWTSDRGFFLNGKHVYIRGANAHQDHSGWGIGITQAAIRRDVRMIKEAGMNFVRGAHYPHHPAFARACDELGLLCWSENCFWGKGGFGPEGYWNASAFPIHEEDQRDFGAHCRQTLVEMIRSNRNSPSIVCWSMTNEAFFTYHVDKARELVSELVDLSHTTDPTRPAASGGCQRGGFDQIGDIAGYNGDGARLFLDPGRPNMVSEYGAISKPPDAFEPFFGDLQPEPFKWRSGQAIWCMFDYGTIAGRQGLKGIVDHARVPKRSWHWYRQSYLNLAPPDAPIDGTPTQLRIDAGKTTITGTDALDDVQLIITLHDDAGRRVRADVPITLTIEAGPGELPTGRSITFDNRTDIKHYEGAAGIAMRSYHAGVSRLRATAPGCAEATIEITTIGEVQFEEGATPIVAERAYVPPELSEQAKRSVASIVNVARDRPSRASSEHADHPARHGNDGHADTHWQASDGDAHAWWQVDLEGYYQIASSRITFPAEGNWRFVVSISEDGQTWEEAVDRRETVNTAITRNDVYPPGAIARYWRIAFVSAPEGWLPALRDLELQGVLSTT